MTIAELRDLIDGAYPGQPKEAMRWRPDHTRPPLTLQQRAATTGQPLKIITEERESRS